MRHDSSDLRPDGTTAGVSTELMLVARRQGYIAGWWLYCRLTVPLHRVGEFCGIILWYQCSSAIMRSVAGRDDKAVAQRCRATPPMPVLLLLLMDAAITMATTSPLVPGPDAGRALSVTVIDNTRAHRDKEGRLMDIHDGMIVRWPTQRLYYW